MGSNNGVIRTGARGRRSFAFGERGQPFELDVVDAMYQWIAIDDEFRIQEGEGTVDSEVGTIPDGRMAEYHAAAVAFCDQLAGPDNGPSSKAEALEFIKLLREQYDELANFFRRRSPAAPASPASSAGELRFSVEES